MSGIRLKKLTATGAKGTSAIKFGNNLTIIAGPSNTGKSYIYRCIDYMFAGDKEKAPWDPGIGYDKIELELDCDGKSIVLTRKIGNLKTNVASTSADVESKEYSQKEIDSLFLKLMGFKNDVSIPKNVHGETQHLSWRMLKKVFMIHEDDTETLGSILLHIHSSQETALLSGLLFCLYEQDFSAYDSEKEQSTKKIRKAAVQSYIIQRRDLLGEKKKELQSALNNGEEITKEKTAEIILKLRNQLQEVQQKISNSIKENQNISKDIAELQNRIGIDKITLKKYVSLEEQYSADIKRLSFIVDNEDVVSKNKVHSTTCPFCNGKMSIKEDDSYIEASRGELRRTVNNLQDLSLSKNDIEEEIKKFSNNIEILNNRLTEVEKTQNNDLLPSEDEIQKKLVDLQTLAELSSIEQMDKDFQVDFNELDKIVDEKKGYKPKELFPETFFAEISDSYLNILKATKYKKCLSAVFERSTFDVTINGKAKDDNGKGYRAYFNSLLLLSLKNYFNIHAMYDPRFLLIDSPLHGLSVPDSENDELTIRQGFFDYLVKASNKSQIIVFDNTEKHDLPEIKHDENVIIEKFTGKDNVPGRYGFLEGIKND